MAKRWLVTTEEGRGNYAKETVKMYEEEKDVLGVVADIAADNSYDAKKLESIYKVDLTAGTMEKFEVVLEKMKLKLKEVAK